ncbi:glycoside hydrolase family 19 protein [Leptodesmis sp.]|uniref:glycoside hydrolase family 19 protein n=1 Tax=Leptodesmis sp. TaxID=3100501 RepID=UPI00405354C7
MSPQLDIWRVQAFQRLITLIGAMKGGVCPSDELIDELVRSLSKLPARPAGKPPYLGIFAIQDCTQGRQKAIERLRVLRNTLQGDLCPADGYVDDLIRTLSNLPKRPADRPPYAGLFPKSNMRILMASDLLKIAPEAPAKRAEQLAPNLNRAMIEFEIITPLCQAHFLAQIAHESDRFNAMEEYASGAAYEWRDDLGNIYPGDGVRYKGRGLIQITGRANYHDCGRALGVDLISNPTRLADPDLACRSAGWYWHSRQLNKDAARDDVRTVTRVINGGYNGLDDRIQLLTAAKRVLEI